ncbi:helix-turn-helix domain-containing protein [Sphingomonas sp. RS2018]
MSDSEASDIRPDAPSRPGEALRAAREARDFDLGEIAQRTRVPQRHLESIEAGRYSDLPSMTYAIGFGRAYARAIGLDEVAIARDIRAEIANSWDRPGVSAPVYEVEDVSRTPSRGLVMGGVVVALLLLAGLYLFYGTTLFRGNGSTPADPVVAQQAQAPAAPVAAPTPAGPPQVTLTANDEVWVRIYDAADTTLLMKTMAPGERYDVPPAATGVKINVGRPDKLAITVGGQAVAALGDGRVPLKNVSLAAADLRARQGAPAAQPTAAPLVAPETATGNAAGTP